MDMLTDRRQTTPDVTELVAVLRTAFGETVDDAFARGKGGLWKGRVQAG